MIKIIEKDFLNDDFILKTFTSNVSINNKINFSKKDVYYFGNYNENKLKEIEKKLINNKKSIINAVEKGVKFLIHGNSIDLFNNSFKHDKLNLFTCYDNRSLKIKKNKIKIKTMYSKSIKCINSLDEVSDSMNFRYKNLICFMNKNAIKKQSISTLSY